ncbi:hypothetical protein PULV_a2983 [Pseudoalteromonas ulvae UL12]|uniref:M23/M56 family metallopeptidase n=1 Tax=Pseudoalteromonas ulvae TaxID=107327 RepID=UPI00186B6CC2|nr:M23/M56 family metallopeptidase [Pseudoalteromonas ulvae]MBE0362365.1 hypothetical protein [Pseudoalteromonas ulvae UL12]
MDHSVILSAFFIPLLAFIVCSAVLSLLSLVINKYAQQLYLWSRFWLILLVLALLPFFPLSLLPSQAVIPDILKQEISSASGLWLAKVHQLEHQVSATVSFHEFMVVLFWLCVLAVCLGLIKFIRSVRKVTAIITQAKAISDFSWFTSAQQDVIRRNRIKVKISQLSHSPFVFGFFKPVLVLPFTLNKMEEAQRHLIFEHELTHLKRHDHRAVLLFSFFSCVCWFNPFIKRFEQRFIISMELECDQAVVSNHHSQKATYARALISSLKLNQATIMQSGSSYFGDPLCSKQFFEQRIRATMANTPATQLGGVHRLMLAMILLFSCSFMVLAQSPHLVLSSPLGDGRGQHPVQSAFISSDFDEINLFRGEKPHQGIDFAAPSGTPIIASFSGKVLIADDTSLASNYGKVILIEHGQHQGLYAHLKTINVSAGQMITAGDVIGEVGSTGRVTGPHLHFELLKNGSRVNPRPYLNL